MLKENICTQMKLRLWRKTIVNENMQVWKKIILTRSRENFYTNKTQVNQTDVTQSRYSLQFNGKNIKMHLSITWQTQ